MSVINTKAIFSLAFALTMCVSVFGQLNLPQKSPKASVSYTIGYTQVTVNYSSPAVGKRTIWGELVPMDKVWRAGANEATTVEFSTDVKIGKETLPAGKYGFFIIPKKGDTWTAVFNSVHEQWGAYEYDESKDVLRKDIKVQNTKRSVNRLQYEVVEKDATRGYIKFSWEKKATAIWFQVDYMDQAMTNIEEAIKGAPEDKKWQVYAASADFLADSEDHLDDALKYASKSTELFTHSWNLWIKAQIQAKKGDYKGAIATADEAKKASASNEEDTYYDDIKAVVEKHVADWQTKA